MRTDPQLRIRLPADCKAFVESQAQQFASSQNSVVVRAIRALMTTTNENRPDAPTSDRFEAKSAS